MKHLSFFRILFASLLVLLCRPGVNSSRAYAQGDTLQSKQAIVEYLSGAQIRLRGPNPDIVPPVNPLRIKVPFDFNSYRLNPAAKHQLDELGEALKSSEIGTFSIKLAGHTDTRGSEQYNLVLSQQRVNAAKSYIVKKFGIDPKRITAIGYGEQQPIIRDATEEAQHAVNRRVEIYPAGVSKENPTRRLRGAGSNDDQFETALEPSSEAQSAVKAGGLSVEFGILHVDKEGNEELLDYRGMSTLNSGDAYRIYVHPQSQCYTYLYQVDSKGKGSWLFPRGDVSDRNPLTSNDYWLPSRSTTFTLDETSGKETVYLVASRKPANDLERFFRSSPANSSTDAPSEAVTVNIKLRGLGKIKLAPSSEGKEKSVDILGKSARPKPGSQMGKTPERKPLNPATAIGPTGDFYVTLTFNHQ